MLETQTVMVKDPRDKFSHMVAPQPPFLAEVLRQTDIAKETYDLKIHGRSLDPNGGDFSL